MTPTLCGIETEYGCAAFDAGGRRMSRANAPRILVGGLGTRWPCLKDLWGHGVFLCNGARCYVDAGGHPEYATPECADPWSVVRHVEAGHRIMATLAADVLARRGGIDRLIVSRANVDYVSGETWGSHESYLVRHDLARVWARIVPHLVSRIVVTGAGGFDTSRSGASFVLSPRVAHLKAVQSTESTHSRGIVHQKHETLAMHGYSRLHLVCGESLASETATFLRMGATALVVALADAGIDPTPRMHLADPLAAMTTFSRDPNLRATARVGLRAVRALDVQRRTLETVEAHLGHAALPEWAADVCARWRQILDLLDGGWEAAATVLDWPLKLSLFRDLAIERGLEWNAVRRWNVIVAAVEHDLREVESGQRLTPSRLEAHRGAIASIVGAARGWLVDGGCDPTAIGDFVELYWEMLETDLRFSQLGPDGLFETLDTAGLLDHRQPGVGPIEPAMSLPPDGGRARVRGAVIRRHADSSDHVADWLVVRDDVAGMALDLRDPFVTEERWRPFGEMAEAL